MDARTHARTHTDSHTQARAHTHKHTHTLTHSLFLSPPHTHTPVAYQGNETEEKVFKKRKVFKEDLKEVTEGEWQRL